MEKLAISPWCEKPLQIMKLSSIYLAAFAHHAEMRIRFDVRC